MLESHGLILAPWARPPRGPDRQRRRTIRDAVSGEPLGFARRAAPRPRWLGWLAPAVVEVFESEDDSLLCTVRGAGWGRGWRILDADGRLVAAVHRDTVLDSMGDCLALVERGAGRFRAPSGLVLATLAPSEAGAALTFLPASEGEPFVRMALLGAALALTS